MMFGSTEHVAELAGALADEMTTHPDLGAVLATAVSLCANPQVAGRVMMALAAIVAPMDDAERTLRVQQTTGARLGFHLPLLDDGAAVAS